MDLVELQKKHLALQDTHIATLKELNAALLQNEDWRKYVTLLQEELESAIGIAYVHGWKSTPEKIQRGIVLRKKLGLPEGAEKQKPAIEEVCPDCWGEGSNAVGPHREKCETCDGSGAKKRNYAKAVTDPYGFCSACGIDNMRHPEICPAFDKRKSDSCMVMQYEPPTPCGMPLPCAVHDRHLEA